MVCDINVGIRYVFVWCGCIRLSIWYICEGMLMYGVYGMCCVLIYVLNAMYLDYSQLCAQRSLLAVLCGPCNTEN